jgi:hypothetical protein
MGNNTVKVILCVLVIGALFAGLGCTGRAAERDGHGSIDQTTPTPSPATTTSATPAQSSTPQPTQSPASPSPTAQPAGAGQGNYTTTLALDDVFFSGGDQDYSFP